MRKSVDSPPRRPASRRVSIASGAHVQRIDLETLFGPAQPGDSAAGEVAAPALGGAAMTGGGAQSPAVASAAATHPAERRSRTVALRDGTEITFTAAEGVRTLESA